MIEIDQHALAKNRWSFFRQLAHDGVPSRPIGLGFLGWWILANVLAGVAGTFLAQVVTGHMNVETYNHIIMEVSDIYRIIALKGLTLGIAIGVFGWLALRRYFPVSLWWVLATGFGWSITYVVGHYLGDSLSEALEAQTYFRIGDVSLRLADILLATIIGSLIGFPQCAAFKRQLGRVEFWILANVAAWAILLIISPIMDFTLKFVEASQELSRTELMLRWSLAGVWLFAILGLVTGATLLWLLRRPAPAATNVDAKRHHKT